MDEEVVDVQHEISSQLDLLWNNGGETITSFDDLVVKPSVDGLAADLFALGSILNLIIGNIKNSNDVEDKFSAIEKAVADYKSRADEIIALYRSETKSSSRFLLQSWVLKDKAVKVEGGVAYSASDFAYAPDPKKPSTWKLRIAEGESGNVTVEQLGRAAAAFSKGGFRGNKVELPDADVASAKRRIRSAYKKLGVEDDDIPDAVKEKSGLMLWKDNGGRYRFFAVYSNCFRDDDTPSEIISSESHKNFDKALNDGEIAMPELWLWHTAKTCFGRVDWHHYDEETGMAMASGYILPGHEKEAQALEQRDDIALSHGMPLSSISRSKEDSSVIIKHRTVEISVLPVWAAANKFTGFSILQPQEDNVAIPEGKKKFLREVGLTDEAISDLEKSVDETADLARESGRESKSNDADTSDTEAADTGQTEAEQAEEKQETVVADASTPAAITADDLKQIIEPIVTVIKSLKEELDQLKSSQETEKKEREERQTEMTPAASLAGYVARSLSIIGKEETRVNKNSPLAKDAPEEQADAEAKSVVSDPLLGGAINRIVFGK